MRWRLKSTASRLFTQPFIQAQIKENIKIPHHWPFYGNSQVTGEFPSNRASNAENVSIWWRHHGVPGGDEIGLRSNVSYIYRLKYIFVTMGCLCFFRLSNLVYWPLRDTRLELLMSSYTRPSRLWCLLEASCADSRSSLISWGGGQGRKLAFRYLAINPQKINPNLMADTN